VRRFLLAVVPALLFIGMPLAIPAQAALTPEQEQLCAEVLANPDAHPPDLVEWCQSEMTGDSTPPSNPPAAPGNPPPSSDPGDEDGKPGHGHGDNNHGHDGPPGQNK